MQMFENISHMQISFALRHVQKPNMRMQENRSLDEPEIGHFGLEVVIEQHVGRAQVAVHHLL